MHEKRTWKALAATALALIVEVAAGTGCTTSFTPVSAPPRPAPSQPSGFQGFQGAWCAQGDPRKRCSISGNGQFLTFTNEVGSTSSGNFAGAAQNAVIANQWGFVQGTLSPDERRISWSNGTYWTRCPTTGFQGFQGAWCAQGDPNKRCSITGNGTFLTFTNEVGSTSSGNFAGAAQNAVVANQWGFVQGTLSPDERRISWSNGTYWTRCPTTGGGGSTTGGGGPHVPNLQGTWYQSGDRSKLCSIQQREADISLTNEVGQHASGRIDGQNLTTSWSGKRITGRISPNGNTIHWENGTIWTR